MKVNWEIVIMLVLMIVGMMVGIELNHESAYYFFGAVVIVLLLVMIDDAVFKRIEMASKDRVEATFKRLMKKMGRDSNLTVRVSSSKLLIASKNNPDGVYDMEISEYHNK